MIKAILMDMDGTITDTEKLYNKYWIKAHHEAGYLDFTYEDALFQRSLNHEDSLAHWHAKYGPDYDWDGIHIMVRQWLKDELEANGIDLKPGILELVDYCKKNNIKTAVVTATHIDSAMQRLGMAGIADVFDTVISASMVKKGKPYPDVYLHAAKELGLDPSECIAVEDSPNGVLSAYRAGCKTIMVPDLTEPDEATKPLLFARCDTLADIIEYL